MPKNNRKFETLKSEKKLLVLQRWKSGDRVSKIAEDLDISRDTVYRWLKTAENRLAKNANRKRQSVDQSTKNRIIEILVLLGKPSYKRLSEELDRYYGIQLEDYQCRYLIKKWGLDSYEPSSQFASIQRLSAETFESP